MPSTFRHIDRHNSGKIQLSLGMTLIPSWFMVSSFPLYSLSSYPVVGLIHLLLHVLVGQVLHVISRTSNTLPSIHFVSIFAAPVLTYVRDHPMSLYVARCRPHMRQHN